MSLFQADPYRHGERFPSLAIYDVGKKGFHCYFGYYDKSPVNETGEFLCYLQVKDKAKPTDEAQILVMNTTTRESRVVGKTTTWNWQQGCMLQWVGRYIVSYNTFDEASNSYKTVWTDIRENKIVAEFARAAYSYDSRHERFLSLNFHRLDLYAKGYGYPYPVDDMDAGSDGIWELDTLSGKERLIVNLKRVQEHEAKDYFDLQHYINHAAYTPDGQSVIFIHRWQKKGGEFTSRLLSLNLSSGQLQTVLDNGHVSHYCWKSDNVLLIYATDAKGHKGYMEVNIETKETRMLSGLPDEDGHPSFSGDLRWILTDTYPSWKRYQYLFLFDTTSGRLKVLDKLWSPFRYFNDERCDLHPRWSTDCQYVCADNTRSGYRSIRVYKVFSA